MNKIFMIPFFLLWINSNAQVCPCDPAIFKNDSIKFNIYLITPSVTMKVHPKNTYVIDLHLSKQVKNCLLGLDSTFWLNQLHNPHSDWASNLILYYIYEEDGSTIAAFPNREKWLQIKYGEIYKWQKYFAARQSQKSE